MKNINKLFKVGNTIEITHRLAKTPDQSYTIKGDYAEKTYSTVVSDIEDKGDFYYVHHHPVDRRNGVFGHFKVFKYEPKRFGVVAINGIELY